MVAVLGHKVIPRQDKSAAMSGAREAASHERPRFGRKDNGFSCGIGVRQSSHLPKGQAGLGFWYSAQAGEKAVADGEPRIVQPIAAGFLKEKKRRRLQAEV
jgi:hypothetical protein